MPRGAIGSKSIDARFEKQRHRQLDNTLYPEKPHN